MAGPHCCAASDDLPVVPTNQNRPLPGLQTHLPGPHSKDEMRFCGISGFVPAPGVIVPRDAASGLENKTPAPCDAGRVKAERGYFRRRNSSRLKPPKLANVSMEGSGTSLRVAA